MVVPDPVAGRGLRRVSDIKRGLWRSGRVARTPHGRQSVRVPKGWAKAA